MAAITVKQMRIDLVKRALNAARMELASYEVIGWSADSCKKNVRRLEMELEALVAA